MDARSLIVEADEIRRGKEISQAEWSRRSGFDQGGMKICRTFNKGDCKLTTMVSLLNSLGYELKITKSEDMQ